MNRRAIVLVSLTAAVALLALILWLASGGSPPATRSAATAAGRSAATRPAAIPSGAGAPSALPEEFAVLQTRNPFSPGSGHSRAPGTESSLVFRGAVREGPKFTALIEDLAVKQVTRGVVGDKLARGRIAAINLDGLTYAAGGSSRRILVGQNLEGTVIPPTPPPPPPPPANPSPDQQGPPAQGRPGAPGGMRGNPGGQGEQGSPPRNRGPAEG